MQNIPPDQPPPGAGNYPPLPPGQPPFYSGNYPPPPGQQPPYPGGTFPPPPPGQAPYPPAGGYGAPAPGYNPYPYPYPYSYGPPPPPRRPGMPAWAWLVLLIPIGAIVMCVVGFGTLVGAGVAAKADAEKVLDQFMRAAASNRIDEAYALYAPLTRQQYSRDQLQRSFDAAPYLPDYQNLESTPTVTYRNSNGQEILEISGRFKFRNRGSSAYDATLQKINGNWRILNLSYPPPA